MLAALTDAQIDALYFAERDDKGTLIPPPALAVAARAAAAEPFWPRAEFVPLMLARHGQTEAHWHAQYDLIEEQQRAQHS